MSLFDDVIERIRDAMQKDVEATPAARTTLDDALLLREHAESEKAAGEAVTATQSVGATLARQNSALDAAADRSRLLGARGLDAGGAVARVREALDRAKLVALNAGLDGSRQGEARGRALVLLAEEIGESVRGGGAALEELTAQLDQLESDRQQLTEDLATARAHATELAQELLRAQSAQRSAQSSLQALGGKLRSSSGADPETARLLTDVADHARGLLDALSELSRRPQRSFILRAVAPTLRPLLRVLRELDRRGHEDET